MADKKHKWVRTEWAKALDDAVTVGLTGIGIALVSRVVAPVKTGRLKGSITYAVHGLAEDRRDTPSGAAQMDDGVSMPLQPHTLHVGTNVEYATVVEYGGRAEYTIRPKEKKALFWKGAPHPMKKVTHPPMKAQPFLRPALDETIPQFKDIFQKSIEDAVMKHGK